MQLLIQGQARTSAVMSVAAVALLGSSAGWADSQAAGQVTPVVATQPVVAMQSCDTNTSASGLYWHVKCSSLLSGKTQYRAVADCKSGNRAYGKWTTVPEGRYIGSVAYCGSGVQPWNSGYEMR